MRALIRRKAQLVLDDVAEPEAGRGQTLVKSLVCGICGSDLHQLHHLEHVAAAGKRSGLGDWIDPNRDVIFGHEFCAEIIEHGPGSTSKLKPGQRVVSMPFVMAGGKAEWVGISNHVPGAFAERFLLSEDFLLPVPNGLPSEHAALVEPLAVGAHAVAESGITRDAIAMIIGCGPVGLALIAALKVAGHEPIVACDFSPARRAAAEKMGAHVVIDPSKDDPHARWETLGAAPTLLEQMKWAAAGRASKPSVVFECAGAPGLIQRIIDGAPPKTRIVVVGACMQPDTIEPVIALNKQIELRFVLAYTAGEFAATLHNLAEGHIDGAPLVTDIVSLESAAEAFNRLSTPGADVKILVRPGS
jgi:threonine dehydrogenase-like Zn-dependent dehydrogenase